MCYEVMLLNEEQAPEYFTANTRIELYSELIAANPDGFLVFVNGLNVSEEVLDQLRYFKRQMANKAAKGV